MFDADRPIVSKDQDRLNRALFCQYLARCMLDHQNPESLVLGLYGGFGVGKTSVINMVLEELKAAASNMFDEEKPIILSFSPWSYSGQHQLIYSFFRRVSSALRQASYLENSERIIHLLELYVSFFTQKPIPKSLRTKRSLIEKMTQTREEIYAWESGRDLTSVKMELNELLSKHKHKIIIIIDNISRLHDYEIKQIFQIVKSIGDYANTAYLLAFDKQHVIDLLNKTDMSNGKELIEKVIQLPFEIPPILQHDLENILSDRLGNVLKSVPNEAWNNEYWSDIYYNSMKFFFHHCRDITRYINTLSFSYSRLKDVVNPVDFFALTAIEVFLPGIYVGVRDNKDLFTDLLDHVYEIDAKTANKDKMRCEEILSRNHTIPREMILDLLMRLFPRIRHIYNPNTPFFHSDVIARKQKRICSPDLFEIYFRLSMQPGQMLQSEFDTILALSSDEIAFDHALTRLNQDERITPFLDQLDGQVLDQLPHKFIFPIISALLNNGDLFPKGNNSLLSLNTAMRIHRIIRRLLRQLNQDERFLLMKKAIDKATKSIDIIIYVLNEQSREHTTEDDTFLPIEFRDLQPNQLIELQKITVKQIEEWAKRGRLAEHPRLFAILSAWQNWGDSDKCQQFVVQLTQTDRGLIAFLIALLDDAINQAMYQYEKNPIWEKCLADMARFIQPESLKDHATLLFEDNYFEKLREKEQLALMIFLDLIKVKTKKVIPQTSG